MKHTLNAVTLLSIACCLPAVAAAHGPVPPASFLQYSVTNVPELGQEITISPVVRTRLARHFHISEAEMSQYILHRLTLSHLTSPGFYRVACVRPDGSEYWVRSRLPAGTAVFASRATGTPVLKLACGNPMVVSLPSDGEKSADENSKRVAPKVSQMASATPQDNAYVNSVLMTENAPANAALVTDAQPEDAILDQAPVVKTAGSLEFASAVPTQSLADLGPVLAAAAAIAAAAAGHGHNGSSAGPAPTGLVPQTPPAPVIPNPRPPVPVAPVPEAPSSIGFGILLLLGGGWWLVQRKRLA